jgi:archaeal flagellar protein FlaJ
MMTTVRVPLLLMGQKTALRVSHLLLGFSSRLKPMFPFLEGDFYKLDADTDVDNYLAASVLNAIMYLFMGFFLAFAVLYRLKHPMTYPYSIITGVVCSLTVFFVCLIYPRWISRNRIKQLDRDLLFAARHLRIQTTANVPLFEALVSASDGYGAVSEEFSKIVKNVQAGTNLSVALEESAAKNPSYYYNRILWQISNAVKAGTTVGPVLAEIVDFLAEEQRIDMRNYGAQLNTLAIMYLMACIIGPTIGLIFMMVISSFVELPINDTVMYGLLGGVVFVQYMFVGMIESRRPVVEI